MKNSLIALNILFGVNSVSLFNILFGMHYLVILNILFEFTDKFQKPKSLSEFLE